jgi:hypothetical protein
MIGTSLAYAETALEQQRARTGGTVAGHGTSKLDPNEDAADLVEQQCTNVLRLMEPYRDELGSIPTNVELLKIKLQQSRNIMPWSCLPTTFWTTFEESKTTSVRC